MDKILESQCGADTALNSKSFKIVQLVKSLCNVQCEMCSLCSVRGACAEAACAVYLEVDQLKVSSLQTQTQEILLPLTWF